MNGDVEHRRQIAADLRQRLAHGPGDADRGLVADAEHVHPDGRLAVVLGMAADHAGEGLVDVGDVGQPDQLAAGRALDDDVAQRLGLGAARIDVQQDLAVGGPDIATGDVARVAGHRPTDLAQGQAVLAQARLIDLDVDLVRAHAVDGGLRDAGQPGDAVAHHLGGGSQRVVRRLTVDEDIEHVAAPTAEIDVGLLGAVGEGGDAVDRALDLVGRALQLGALDQLQSDVAAADGRGRAYPGDALDPAHRLLDRQHHTLLDLLRRGARIGDGHLDRVLLELGKDLLGDARAHVEPADDQRQHDQVGGDPVANQPADQAAHGAALTRHRRSRPGRSAPDAPAPGRRAAPCPAPASPGAR